MHDRSFERSSQTLTCPATAEFSYTVQDIHVRCDQASRPLSNEQPRNEVPYVHVRKQTQYTVEKGRWSVLSA